MPSSYGRVKVPLDEALNYFLDYYNKVYDRETGYIISDEFNVAIFNFLGPQDYYRNQIKNLRNSRYIVYAKTYQKDYRLVIREPYQDENPTHLSNNQIETLESLLEYVNSNMGDIEKSSKSVLKEQLFPGLLFIILVIAIMIYFIG